MRLRPGVSPPPRRPTPHSNASYGTGVPPHLIRDSQIQCAAFRKRYNRLPTDCSRGVAHPCRPLPTNPKRFVYQKKRSSASPTRTCRTREGPGTGSSKPARRPMGIPAESRISQPGAISPHFPIVCYGFNWSQQWIDKLPTIQ